MQEKDFDNIQNVFVIKIIFQKNKNRDDHPQIDTEHLQKNLQLILYFTLKD